MFDFSTPLDRIPHDCLKWSYLDGCCPDRDDILPMWIADMDLAAPPAVLDAIHGRAAHPVYGYAGKPDGYYSSYMAWMKTRYGVDVRREWIEFSPGIVPAIASAIRAFSAPGDGVTIMPPVYHPFAHLIEANGRVVREAPLLVADGAYKLDLAALDRAAAQSKLIVLCSPHNPVGRVWTRGELEAVAEIAERHDAIVVADEIHADLVYRPNVHVPSLAVSERLNQRLLACWAPSKTFNIAGLQTSYIVIPNDGLRAAFAKDGEASGVGVPNCFGTIAAQAAYEHGGPWLDELMPFLRGNYDALVAGLGAKAPALKVSPCEGTFLAWIDFRGAGLAGNVHAELLSKAGLWLDAGSRFGTGGDGWARLNFGCPRATVDEAVRRLGAAFGPSS
ncbi:MAG: pyridoxal phosphate-dependent aminotransferase [Spirochaetia bacterium]|nr:pyridoxal phosphate-dependent aminotransferase [Spirochaetia bacterium]